MWWAHGLCDPGLALGLCDPGLLALGLCALSRCGLDFCPLSGALSFRQVLRFCYGGV
jgi:hypothetical protein